MATFLKAQAASLTATAVDFLVTIFLVEIVHVWYVAATAIGTLAGGITNFSMGRNWVFKAKNYKVKIQAAKYLAVWLGNLVLNTWGVFVVTHYTPLTYVMAKIIVSIIVGFTYNYQLQKTFVFKYKHEE